MLNTKEIIAQQLAILKPQILEKMISIQSNFADLRVYKKKDNTPVTEFDLYISEIFKNMIKCHFPNMNYYSEEDKSIFEFPICIIDPIDGTKDFMAARDECAVSFGIYFSNDINDKNNFSWIFNPINQFEISSEDIITQIRPNKESYEALVSRSEWTKELHPNTNDLAFKPVGSIAYKLGLLVSGECDFVITKQPKNIWDILAGTHIGMMHGLKLYQNGKVLTEISDSLYENDMLWCHEENYLSISSKLKKNL